MARFLCPLPRLSAANLLLSPLTLLMAAACGGGVRPPAAAAGCGRRAAHPVPAITLFWAETTLQAPSYPPGPVSLAPSGLWGCPGGAALQTRAYLALMVLLEVTLRVFGFTSFDPILGLNPGWRRTALSQRRWRLSSNPYGSRKYGGCSR